ncbi:MAG: hypothetical protein LM581_03335 [Desulfurococcales archaeon]|nr:hypothetical protein [Desulfurococcales archaeon]
MTDIIINDPDVIRFVKNLKSPLLLYDNYCTLCYRYAKIVWRLSRGRIAVLGMYSVDTEKIRDLIDFSIYTSVPWLIKPDECVMYGGRSMILPILKEILKGFFKKGENLFTDPPPRACSEILPCKGFKGLIYRTVHIMIKSFKIKICCEDICQKYQS